MRRPAPNGLVCIAALLWAAPAFAQGRDPFLGVPKLRGAVSYQFTFSGTSDLGGKVKVTASAEATFLLERVTGSTPTWTGRFESSISNVSLEGQSFVGNCEAKESFTIVGPLQPGDFGYDVRLQMRADSYNFNLSGFRGPTQTSKVVITCPNAASNRTQEGRASLELPSWIYQLPYPGSGTTLTSSGKVEGDGDFSSYHDHQLFLIEWRYNLTISPDAGDLKLEVTSDQYEKWRPTAQKNGDPGDPIEFTARLVRTADGKEAPQDVRSFEWELIDTSQEPGVALNWPDSAKDSDFDMRFLPQEGQISTSEYKQRIVRPVRDTATDKAKVEPIDWGGWATMRVTVELKGGRRITGEFKDTGDKDIRLPKRRMGSLIADSFRKEKEAEGADSSDDEKTPEGDPNGAGDGLTLYEEYRGFYEDGKHIEGNVKVKDYFAMILSGPDAEAGLIHFKNITGLDVHYKLADGELTQSRVINANRRAGPHRVKQHGVTFIDAGYDGFARANGGPGTPKSISYVGLPGGFSNRPTASPKVSYGASTVAHEALHTVNVWHHGQGDTTVKWASVNGVLKEDGANITVRLENGRNITGSLAERTRDASLEREIGVSNGEHSGVEDCVMRYDIAQAYISKADPSVRYTFDRLETPGASLCTQATGTGVNDPNRNTPQPRYFDASAGVGNCKSQILVNDAIAAPKR